MKNQHLHSTLTLLTAIVWLVNGLACKVLNLAPRHQQIVAEIVSEEHSRFLTVLIGIAEIIMAIWIVSRYKPKVNALFQIFVVITMNILEYVVVPELLLWGRMNSLFAILFISLVWYNAFILPKRELQNSSI